VASSLQVAAGGRRLLGFLVALVPVFALHFPLTLFGRSLADAGQVPPAAGVWAANVGAVAVALVLLRRASLR
jgi:lipopolysaccharide export LptBFGC system permease protein LptF